MDSTAPPNRDRNERIPQLKDLVIEIIIKLEELETESPGDFRVLHEELITETGLGLDDFSALLTAIFNF